MSEIYEIIDKKKLDVVNNSIVEGDKILIDKNKKQDNLELIVKEKVEN